MKTVFISATAMLFMIFICWQKGLFEYSTVVDNIKSAELNKTTENINQLIKNIANDKKFASETANLANQCEQEKQFVEIDAPEVEVIEKMIVQATSSSTEVPNSHVSIDVSEYKNKQIELVNKFSTSANKQTDKNKSSVEKNHLNNQQSKVNKNTPIVSIDTNNIKGLFRWINLHNKVALYCDGNQTKTLYRYGSSKWTVALKISEQGALREFGNKMKNVASLPNKCSRLLIVWPAKIWSNITSPLYVNNSLEFAEIELSIVNQNLFAEVVTSKPKIIRKSYKVASL